MIRAILMFALSLLQAPWLVQCQSNPQYGYNGPGVYRIISPSSNLPIGFNISTKDNIRPVVSVNNDGKDATRRWLIAEVSKSNGVTTVVIVSDKTGGVMSYTPFDFYYTASAKPALLSNPAGRWLIDTDNVFYPLPNSGRPIRFSNVGLPGYCLDLEQAWKFPGTRILTYPCQTPATNDNEVWWLECLEPGCQMSYRKDS